MSQELRDRVCCRDIPKINATREQLQDGSEIPHCITSHPGFKEVCLAVYSLQTAYYQYKAEHKRRDPWPIAIHE